MEFSLGDLNKEEDQAFRKIKLRVEDVKVGSGIA
jgi:ribosomal protein S3AE